jgi:hypothetical protein
MASPSTKQNVWVQVVKRNPVSAAATVLKPQQPHNSTSNQSQHAVSQDATTPNIVEILRNKGIVPHLTCIEDDSVLIDITDFDARSQAKLKALLNSFNNPDEDVFVYYGRLPVIRKHLGRSYLETTWDTTSEIYTKLISKGVDMDGTIIRGFKTLPADANVKIVSIARLPYCHPTMLLDQIQLRFRSFGTILDIGLLRDGDCYVGEAYVVLNIPAQDIVEQLNHVVDWIDKKRQIHLKWSGMPLYFRHCDKNDHCRADCPVLLMAKTCFHCHKNGHLIKDCPRMNSSNKKVKSSNTSNNNSNSNNSSNEQKEIPNQSAATTSKGPKRPNRKATKAQPAEQSIDPTAEASALKPKEKKDAETIIVDDQRNKEKKDNGMHVNEEIVEQPNTKPTNDGSCETLAEPMIPADSPKRLTDDKTDDDKPNSKKPKVGQQQDQQPTPIATNDAEEGPPNNGSQQPQQ